jgi:hypothetical protein
MASSSQDFAETYSKMSDDELLRIEADRESLVEEAKLALGQEIQNRQISMSNIPPEEEGPAETTESASARSGSPWWGRLLVFLAWSAAGLAFVLITFGRTLNGTAAETFAEATTRMFLYAAFAGWGITQVIAGRWLTIKRTIIIATVMYAIGIGWYAIILHKSDARQERIHQLSAQARSLGPVTKDFRWRLGQILGRDPQTFAEFESRNDDLESLLDSGDSTTNRSRAILGQLQEELVDSPNAQSMISLEGQVLDDDTKFIGYLREEIACSRGLSGSSKFEQSSFRERCIAPAQEKMSPLFLNEEKLLRELQSKGATLPSDLAEALR